MNLNEPTGWDPKKKAERDHARDVAIARKRVGDLYSDHVNRLTKRARTRKEVIQWLYDLQKALDETERGLGETAAEVFPWQTTREMISSKIAVLMAVQICQENTAIQHVPVTMLMRTDGKNIRPKRKKFRTVKEFQEIDFVKHFSEQPGFRGFFSKMSFEALDIKYFVIAEYEKDSCIACELENDVALDDFAQYDDVSPESPSS